MSATATIGPTSAEVAARIPLGTSYDSPWRTITEGEFSLSHSMIWASSELHANRVGMAATEFGERIMAGPLVLSYVLGLATSSGFHQALESCGVTIQALLGMGRVDFPHPVLPGTTIQSTTRIHGARPSSSRHGYVVLELRDEGHTSNGEIVCQSVRFAFARGSEVR